MPIHVPTFLCLLISPGDVDEERDAVEEAVNAWNGQIGKGLGVRVETVRWESHARPAMGKPPQDAINEQMVDGCDFGIAIFWSRLGSPTTNHPSGSAEEVERLLAKGADVMVYFSEKPIPQSSLKDDQFQRLQKLKSDYTTRGLYSTFDSASRLKELVALNLTSLVSGKLTQIKAEGHPIPSTGTSSAPKPDIRVSVASVIAHHDYEGTKPFVQVRVENHSPNDWFFSGVSFTMTDTDSRFAIMRDAMFGTPVMPQKLASGDSLTVHLDPEESAGEMDPARLIGAFASDKIGRTFNAPAGETERAIKRHYEWIDTLKKQKKSGR